MARQKKSNHRGRKKRSVKIFWALATFVLVAGAIIGSLTVFLKVSEFDISGNSVYTKEQIIASSGIKEGDNLFGVNKFEVIEKIKSDFPYIEDVKITRNLPDTFVFEITERKACGYIEEADCYWLVDAKGFLLERIEKDVEMSGTFIVAEEPLITPFAGGEIKWEKNAKKEILVKLMSELSGRDMMDKITEIDVSAMYSIEFVYEDRITVVVGTTEDIEKKMNLFDAVLPKLSANDRGKLNVSNKGEARFTPERIVYDEK